MRLLTRSVIKRICLGLIVILMGLGVWKCVHMYHVKQYKYSGTVIASNWSVRDQYYYFTFLNPNDLADYVRIKIKMDALLTRPRFNCDGALIMLTKNDENDLFLVTCKNAVEKQQINIDASDGFGLYETETGYLVWQYVDDKTSSFYWLNRKGIIEKQITVKDDITRVLSVDNHIIGWVNEKNDVFYTSGEKIHMDGFDVGVLNESQFLVPRKDGTYILDRKGRVVSKYSDHPYWVSAAGKDINILRMYPRGSGGYHEFRDDEWTIKDWIRTDYRQCYVSFLHNWKLDDVVNLPEEIEKEYQDYYAYQDIEYNRENLEKLKELIENDKMWNE